MKARVAGWALLAFFLLPHAAAHALLENQAIPTQEVPLLSTRELPFKPLDEEKKAEPLSPHRDGGLWEFLSERVEIGYGTDQQFNDNLFLQDNDRKEELVSTIESVLAFYDPRGALLYGSQWEINAYRFMKSNANAIDHDVVSFIDWDPGGRYRLHLTHTVQTENRLVFGAPGVDLLRRSGGDFQPSATHSFEPRVTFFINEDDAVIGKATYTLFDDQVKEDASTDRKLFKGTLDWNHNITRTWSVYAGALYREDHVPGDKLKNLTAWGGRVGARYQLTLNETFEALVELDRPKTRGRERNNDLNYSFSWGHLLGPRADFKLGLTDARRTSFTAGRTQFRSRSPSFEFNYQLTPLVTTNVTGLLEKQKSSVAGNSITGRGEVNKFWSLQGGFKWQLREQLSATFSYNHSRSTTRDYTNRVVTAGFEGTF